MNTRRILTLTARNMYELGMSSAEARKKAVERVAFEAEVEEEAGKLYVAPIKCSLAGGK